MTPRKTPSRSRRRSDAQPDPAGPAGGAGAGTPDPASIDRLLEVMARLRDPVNGCPWDLQQDHRTLKAYLVEEAHEVLEAIDLGDPELLREELGDLLIQVVFHARMAEEKGQFDFDGVAEAITSKLIRRHPHVFGDARIEGATEVLRNWEQIKKKEKHKESILDGVPDSLPSLLKAYRVQEKASIVGFDWKQAPEVMAKVEEEVSELREVLESGENVERLEDEFGDLLFSLVNLGRFLRINAEFCLQKSIRKFVDRFRRLERAAAAQQRTLGQMTLEEMDALWEDLKAGGEAP